MKLKKWKWKFPKRGEWIKCPKCELPCRVQPTRGYYVYHEGKSRDVGCEDSGVALEADLFVGYWEGYKRGCRVGKKAITKVQKMKRRKDE